MEINIPISDEALYKIMHGIEAGNYWISYDSKSIFYDREGINLFQSRAEAIQFIAENHAGDGFKLMYAPTIQDVLKRTQIQYLSSSQNNLPMNQQNEQYLQNNIKFLGFSDSVFPELNRNLQNGQPEFVLRHEKEYGQEKLESQLHFKKSQTSDMYFINMYLASLVKSNQERVSQMIYLDRGNGLTQKETYNLLHGRAVNQDLTNKQGEKYNAWLQLDFSEMDVNHNYKVKQYHEAYKYDLAATLEKYGIKELGDEQQKARLLESLERGNRQQVSFEKDGVVEKLWIEANPQFKSLNVYDEHNQKVHIHKIAEKYGKVYVQQPPAQKQNVAEPQKQTEIQSQKPMKEKVSGDDLDAPKKKQEKRMKQNRNT